MFKIDSVGFSYNGQSVLDSVSVQIKNDEFVGIIGPNGAGKSTLLKIMSKILKPESGGVYFRNSPIEELTRKEIARKMAVLPAETFFAYDFSVLEIVKMGRSPYLKFWSGGSKNDLKIVQDALETVGISYLAERNIHSISSGERQMVLLAQALAQEPEIILLDEPTVHLDISHQIQIFKLLREWNERRKLTIVMISHDLNLASQFCNRLILLHQGKIVADGKPEEVLTEENLRKVYGVKIKVIASPLSGLPAIFFE